QRAAWCTDGSSLAHQLLVRAARHDLHHTPPLVARQWPALLDAHGVADAGIVLLVVRLELAREADDALVDGVPPKPLDAHHHRLVHLVGHHVPDLRSSLALHQLAAFWGSAGAGCAASSLPASAAACWRSVMTVRIRAMRFRVAGRRL